MEEQVMRAILLLVAAIIMFSGTEGYADGQSVSIATVTNVREVFKTITLREPITTREEMCENDSGLVGALIGGAAGGLIGNQFGRGTGNVAMTALGAVAGAATGQHVAQGQKCYPRDRVSYVEREKDVIDGYIVTVDNGEEFRTKSRYHIGDRVRIRSTIE
jgi:outer membrane lipoprotein SlyB